MSDENKIEFINLLDDYLDGKVDEATSSKIENALEQNPFNKKILEQHIQARANIRLAGESDLKNKFLGNFEPISELGQKPPIIKKVMAAILIIVGLFVISYLFIINENNKEKITVKDTSVPVLAMLDDPSYDLLRSKKDTLIMSQWREAVKLFVSKDYASVLEALEIVEKDNNFINGHSGKIGLMKGVSFLKLQKFDLAEASFQSIGKTNPYHDQSSWYLAMTAYYKGDKEKAKIYLEDIVRTHSHYKKASAVKYLEQLHN